MSLRVTAFRSSSSLRKRQPSLSSTGTTSSRCFSISSNSRVNDMEHCTAMVKSYDPTGFLSGRLLPTKEMQVGYYAVRSFWVETGLHLQHTTALPATASPHEHLEWWQNGIHNLYSKSSGDALPSEWDRPTFRLLQELIQKHDLPKNHFDNILLGRQKDLDLKQYETLDDLIEHSSLSCGTLLQLVLQCGSVPTSSSAFGAAQSLGICHGLTNALRSSIPIMSTTGRLIIPADLCVKRGVRNPRYLLSALGQGDAECKASLQLVVGDIVEVARHHLKEARGRRETILSEGTPQAVAVLLPGLASATFLDRLEMNNYDLTEKSLRSVGYIEQALCAARMVNGYYQQTY